MTGVCLASNTRQEYRFDCRHAANCTDPAIMPGLASPGIESYRVVYPSALSYPSIQTWIAHLHLIGRSFPVCGNAAIYCSDLRPHFFLDGGYFYGRTVDAGAAPFSLPWRFVPLADAPLCPTWVAVYSDHRTELDQQCLHTRALVDYSTEASHTLAGFHGRSMSHRFCAETPIFHLLILPVPIAG